MSEEQLTSKKRFSTTNYQLDKLEFKKDGRKNTNPELLIEHNDNEMPEVQAWKNV